MNGNSADMCYINIRQSLPFYVDIINSVFPKSETMFPESKEKHQSEKHKLANNSFIYSLHF